MGDGSVVSIALRGRSTVAVATDMVEGIVTTNQLEGSAAELVRRRLLAAVAPVHIDLTAEPVANGPNLAPHARMAERQTQAA